MRLEGTCDFCGIASEWEAGLFDDRGAKFANVKARPADWAAMFPWNKRRLPKTANFSERSLIEHRITTRIACPNCVR